MDRIRAIREELAKSCPALELRENEPMRQHTSFRIGGPVPLMALPKSREEALFAFRAAVRAGLRPLCLGRGSNLLVADAGIFGFAIKCGMEEITTLSPGLLYAESGASLAQCAVFALREGLTGLEFAHGIPGALGGALYMNAGAYGGEMAQVVRFVDCLDESGREIRLEAEQLRFSYRHSLFSESEGYLILGAALALTPGEPENIKARMAELLAERKEKQPLEYPSAGSTFKRPPGQFAGALIEQCGLKGTRVGGAQISEKHAGFLLNTGGASCEDVLALMRLVRARVEERCGVPLEPEVKLLGCNL